MSNQPNETFIKFDYIFYYMNRDELEKRLKKEFGDIPAPDFSNPKVYRELCIKFSEAVTPGLEEVDRLQAKSQENMFKVVRGYSSGLCYQT